MYPKNIFVKKVQLLRIDCINKGTNVFRLCWRMKSLVNGMTGRIVVGPRMQNRCLSITSTTFQEGKN